jgi:hypothetical protein
MLSDNQKSTAFFEGSQALPACPSDNSYVNMINMKHWWSDNNGEKWQHSKKHAPVSVVNNESHTV